MTISEVLTSAMVSTVERNNISDVSIIETVEDPSGLEVGSLSPNVVIEMCDTVLW